MNEQYTQEKDKILATPISDEWNRSVNRLGRITLVIAMIASFGPFLYLYFFHGAQPAFGDIMSAMGKVAIAYAALWIIEPLAYYPSLGNSGSYMGWMVGSVANTRIPASVTAKSIIGVEEETQESEIVSTAAIAGSVVTTILVLTIGVFVGDLIVAMMPPIVMNTLISYVVPVIFGSVLAMLGGNRLQITLPTLAVIGMMNYISRYVVKIPYWVILIIAVGGCMMFTRFMYKRGKVK